jgi:hypothetical protein
VPGSPPLIAPSSRFVLTPAATLQVTVAHHTDAAIREAIYAGNPHSFILSQLDLTTHCGRFDMSLGEVRRPLCLTAKVQALASWVHSSLR